jgi:predicted DNA-binding transcriptional regulator AlpA
MRTSNSRCRAGAASDPDDERRDADAARRGRDAVRRRQAKERRASMRRVLPGDPDARLNPFTIFRPQRLSELLDVDRSTVWRWRRDGTLPEPIEIGSIRGWTFAQIEHLLAQRSARG